MNLTSLLHARAESGRPVRAALIGAGKFGSMFLSQVPTIPGLEVAAIADLDPERARQACRAVGWDDTRLATTRFTDSGRDACAAEDVDVVIEATGSPEAGIAHAVTPDNVWKHYGLTPEEARAAGMNPQMFNSFLDGTKSALEMAAIANACGLDVPEDGLGFPPCGVDDLAHVLRPRAVGGVLDHDGVVEVVSSLERDGRPAFRDLRWGVYVVLKAPNDYAAACFRQYGLPTDATGRYAAMYEPFHLIGLELSISVLSAALRGEPTGTTREWRGDVASTAKRDLKAGETLDGEGGYTVYGKLMPAARSRSEGALP